MIVSLLFVFFSFGFIDASEENKENIRKTIRENLAPVRKCYEDEVLNKKRKTQGKVVMEWDILADGKVDNVVAKESIDKKLEKCLAKTIKTWTFLPPKNGNVSHIIYPFVFSI